MDRHNQLVQNNGAEFGQTHVSVAALCPWYTSDTIGVLHLLSEKMPIEPVAEHQHSEIQSTTLP
jgi:hypothetical protein